MALHKLITLAPSSPQYLGNVWEFESRYITSRKQAFRTVDILSDSARFDRYRTELKGTWKDEPLSAAGQIYDLGAHLIDQALVLFGRPKSLTAFKQNARGIGHPDVDDSVRLGRLDSN